MASKISSVNQYLSEGCGRCQLAATPECKVHSWTRVLNKLRAIVLDCNLVEEIKWSMPCYTFEKANVAMIAAFKDSCTLSFFKGVLLNDPKQLLETPGENSQSVRLLRFTTAKQVADIDKSIRAFIAQAIELEKKGAKVELKAKDELKYPPELLERFKQLPAFEAAFTGLTPGRQRGYILFFNAAKQSKTRLARIEKCKPQIFEGRGLHD